MTSRARWSSVPTTIRLGRLKSSIAAPSRRNSGIGDDGEVGLRPGGADDLLDGVAGADRDRRFGHYHRIAGEGRGDLAGGGVDIAQVGMAVATPRRRADGDEDRICRGDGVGNVHGEAEALLLYVRGYDAFETGLIDRNVPGFERPDACLILVDARHDVAEIRKAGARHETDIAGADHG